MGWLSGWAYGYPQPVNAGSGSGTDYRVEFDLTMAGLNSHARSDFGDVRFTASDGTTQLSYFLQSYVSGISAVFIVRIPSDLSTNGTTVWVYYGNASATTTSNEAATYLFFDDATSDKRSSYTTRQLGASGVTYTLTWDSVNQQYYAIPSTLSMDMLEIINVNSSQGYQFQADYKFGSFTGVEVAFGMACRYSASGVYFTTDWNHINSYEKLGVYKEASPLPSGYTRVVDLPAGDKLIESSIAAKSTNTWYTFTGRIYGSTIYGSDNLGNSTSTTDASFSTGTLGIFIKSQSSPGITYWRNVKISPYTATPPTLGTPGAETIQAPVLVSPINASTGQLTTLAFTWTGTPVATNYNIQIASDSNFTQIIINTWTTGVTITAILSSGRTYYWKVGALYQSSSAYTSGWYTATTGEADGMTLSEVIDLFTVKYKLEVAKRNVKELQIDSKMKAVLVSEAIQNARRETKEFQKYTDVTLVNAQFDYALPTDFGFLSFVEVAGQDHLTILSTEQLEQSIQDQNAQSSQTNPILTPQSGQISYNCSVYSDGTTTYIKFDGTPLANPRVWYYPKSSMYSPSASSAQSWGTFDGSTFSGNFVLSDYYVPPVIEYMLSQIFDDRKPLYDKAINDLKQMRLTTTSDTMPYSLG